MYMLILKQFRQWRHENNMNIKKISRSMYLFSWHYLSNKVRTTLIAVTITWMIIIFLNLFLLGNKIVTPINIVVEAITVTLVILLSPFVLWSPIKHQNLLIIPDTKSIISFDNKNNELTDEMHESGYYCVKDGVKYAVVDRLFAKERIISKKTIDLYIKNEVTHAQISVFASNLKEAFLFQEKYGDKAIMEQVFLNNLMRFLSLMEETPISEELVSQGAYRFYPQDSFKITVKFI